MGGVQIMGVLGAAVVLGAVAGGAVAVLGADDGANPADGAVIDRLDDLQKRVDGLRTSVGETKDALADVRERIVGVELELSHRAARGVSRRGAPSSDAAGSAGADVTEELAQERLAADTAKAVRQAFGQFKSGRWANVQERFANAIKLRALPEEERWAKAEEDLGLTTVQVDELRDALADFQEARKAAFTEEVVESGDGMVTRRRRGDAAKVAAARSEFDRRVGNTLNAEQKKAWSEKGYSTAMGAGGGGSRIIFTGKSGGDGSGVTIIGSDIEIETTEAADE